MPDCGHGWRDEIDCDVCRPPAVVVAGLRARIAELEAALRRITPAYRAACAQLAGQSGDSEFWDSDAEILAECERLIAQ